jgi:hypothetical protein
MTYSKTIVDLLIDLTREYIREHPDWMKPGAAEETSEGDYGRGAGDVVALRQEYSHKLKALTVERDQLRLENDRLKKQAQDDYRMIRDCHKAWEVLHSALYGVGR